MTSRLKRGIFAVKTFRKRNQARAPLPQWHSRSSFQKQGGSLNSDIFSLRARRGPIALCPMEAPGWGSSDVYRSTRGR
jgi:hypothetical protein